MKKILSLALSFALGLSAATVYNAPAQVVPKTCLLETQKQRVSVSFAPSSLPWVRQAGDFEWTIAPDTEDLNVSLDVAPGGNSAWIVGSSGTVRVIVTCPVEDYDGNPLPDYTSEFLAEVLDLPSWQPLAFGFDAPIPK